MKDTIKKYHRKYEILDSKEQVEYDSKTNKFLVSPERINNSIFKIILEQGSVEQICKAIKERCNCI